MEKKLVYDLPTRLFHWLFAGLFVTAFAIAKTIDDDSPTFQWHMLAGLTLSFLVCLRILWGFLGTAHAKFSGFDLKPQNLFTYLKGTLTGDKKRWAGHNPASSWAALVMMACALGLGTTGYLMASGQKESFEDLHELFANTFLVTAILHVIGIIFHTIRHKDLIGLSMINGKKNGISTQHAISKAHHAMGFLLLLLVASFAYYLKSHYTPETGKLNFFGTTLSLGEDSEKEEGEANGKNEEEEEDGD